jgi:predicted enzyme related to lactoylglutathione lyase
MGSYTDTYQLFSVDGQEIGGVLTKPPEVADPFWLYYFNVCDLNAAAQRVAAPPSSTMKARRFSSANCMCCP